MPYVERAEKPNYHHRCQIGRGEFGTLPGWFRENIHRPSSRHNPDEMIERAPEGRV